MKEAKINQRVHIIAVGKDTVERSLIPLKKFLPEKVYLLTVSFEDAFQTQYIEVKKYLEQDLGLKGKIIEEKVDYYNLVEFMALIAKICNIEKKNDNDVYFNISGGTMITIVGTLAALLFKIIPYFAKYDYHKKMINEQPSIPEIPSLIYKKLNEDKLYLLAALDELTKNKEIRSISKGICIDLIQSLKLNPQITEKKPGDYNKLKVHYLKEIKELGFIDEIDRNTIKLTEKGIFAARIIAIYEGVDTEKIQEAIKKVPI